MTRGQENFLRHALAGAAIGMLCGATYIAVVTFIVPTDAPLLGFSMPPEPQPIQKPVATLEPRFAKLAASKMTRTIVPVVPKVEVAVKPASPKLESLLRVKGIMDTGNVKTTEAIVELVRENKTRFVRAGESIPEAGATVMKIDAGVVFQYEGKSVLLQVNGESGVELAPEGKSGALSSGVVEKIRIP